MKLTNTRLQNSNLTSEAVSALNTHLQPPELQVLVLEYLPPEDFRPWAHVVPYQFHFFKTMWDSRFLECVVTEWHTVIRVMLRRDPYLMVRRGRVTDCSKRTFENISGFEYALWAWSKHMWQMMLACVPDTPEGKELWSILLSQYHKVSTEGVTYTLNGKTITERHFDFTNTIIKELRQQINLNLAPGAKDWPAIKCQLITGVGGAQNLLPMCVVDEYCSDEPISPSPKFELRPKSSRKFYNWATKSYEDWWRVDSRRGIEFAIYKGVRHSRSTFGICYEHHSATWARLLSRNLVFLLRLFEARQVDFIKLGEYLDNQVAANCNPQIVPS